MRIRNVLLERYLSRFAVCAASGLFATVRKRFHFADASTSPYLPVSGATYIYSVWHDSLLMPLFLGRQPATVALVGQHGDGTFLANALAALGIGCVRGSTSRGGAQAVRQLITQTEKQHIVVTPDGPRGPRREMKPGVAYIASRTGKPIVPTAFACRSSWSWGSGWTDLCVPKPGTIVYALTGAGVTVPADANSTTLAQFTHTIQIQMDQLEIQARSLASQPIRAA